VLQRSVSSAVPQVPPALFGCARAMLRSIGCSISASKICALITNIHFCHDFTARSEAWH
jgi:hypothetical protein